VPAAPPRPPGELPELSAERIRLYEVDERAVSVDLDDRQPLPVACFQLAVAGDVDLLELERQLRADVLQNLPRAVAEVAAAGRVEGDAAGGGRYG